MRTLPFILLFSTLVVNAQEPTRQAVRLSGNEAVGKIEPAIGRPTSMSEIAESGIEESPVPNAGATTIISAPIQPVPIVKTRTSETTLCKSTRMWWVLTAVQHGSAAFDAWSTRESLSSGNGYERDPLMKPFANSPAIYPALQVLPIGLDYLSNRMIRSQNTVVRRLWWMPQTVSTVGFLWSGARNLHVAAMR